MADHNRPAPYYAFLLRCWQERSRSKQQGGEWRFSLEDPQTGQRRGFATLEAVLAAVQDALANDQAPEPQAEEPH